jgi:thiamine biosynthesis lipoprotein
MSESDLQLSGEEWLIAHNIHRFSHEAMATVFEIFIAGKDKIYAAQAAQAAYAELDRLEEELSRFIENSDISRINNLTKNQSVIISPDTFACLQKCKFLYEDTGGIFDISAGLLINLWRNRDQYQKEQFKEKLKLARKNVGFNNLEIIEKYHEVRLLGDNIELDLGGFGKGYAIDKMGDILSEWSIDKALLHGGLSTVLALNAPNNEEGWPVSISHPQSGKILEKQLLKFKALSGSGLKKGSHIIDLNTGLPTKGKIASWASADSAAISDALSTSFLIMPVEKIERYISKHAGVSALIILPKSDKNVQDYQILRFGWGNSSFIDD